MKKLMIILFSIMIPLIYGLAFLAGSPREIHPHPPENIRITAKLENVKVHNKKAAGTVTVNLLLTKQTDKDVTLTYQLNRLRNPVDATMEEWEKTPLFKGKLTKGETKRFQHNFSELEPGQYKMVIQALSRQNEFERWGDLELIFFTVTNAEVKSGWDEPVPPVRPLSRDASGMSKTIFLSKEKISLSAWSIVAPSVPPKYRTKIPRLPDREPGLFSTSNFHCDAVERFHAAVRTSESCFLQPNQ
ncbi:hypothetical protein JQC72_12565 [Polycladomyces sp. WAk]|uniref:Uncharacterized protein n=1 Tax=Polycladomyces zharkentensis TaxID=2807616 RepID=A0ABS2WL84_9BACL|nr:hypothetical protein [Polycladomyces sp. WAk]MBN2910330.1 hypothetical protein [Polycladomyces sp. WAk]